MALGNASDDKCLEPLFVNGDWPIKGGGIGVMPDPDDNPNNNVVPHHESGARISFEVLNVTYFLRVPPTVNEAVAWSFHKSPDDYDPEQQT